MMLTLCPTVSFKICFFLFFFLLLFSFNAVLFIMTIICNIVDSKFQVVLVVFIIHLVFNFVFIFQNFQFYIRFDFI